MRVFVTRPQAEAVRWVQALLREQIDAVSLPLIEIRPVADDRGVRAAWQAIGQFDAVMFVSAAAVTHFFADLVARRRTLAGRRCAAGLGAWARHGGRAGGHGCCARRYRRTRPEQRAIRFGISLASGGSYGAAGPTGAGGARRTRRGHARGRWRCGCCSADLASWSGARLVGPATDRARRAWCASSLTYRRCAPPSAVLRQAVLAAHADAPACWLFTSSQAIENLVAAVPGHDWASAQALVTHPRIAVAARAAGFGVVQESRPALADVVASIKSLG